jgi:alpha-galactosidase
MKISREKPTQISRQFNVTLLRMFIRIAIVMSLLSPSLAFAVKPTAEELAEARRFTPAFSFIFDGKRYDAKNSAELKTKLGVRVDARRFDDSPTIEWTISFTNEGKEDTPIIENVRAIDVSFDVGDGDVVLHHNTGDKATPDSYEPHADVLTKGEKKTITAVGGRPTQNVFPYFNFSGKDRGVIVAIGWPGQWSASYSREDASVVVSGGQELTHFKLHPGETVRGPRVVVQFYSGDWIRGQNLWRRWMVLHNMPRPEGKPPAPMATLCTGNFYPGLMSNAQQELKFIQQYLDAGVKLDAWWQDAGWYPCDGVTWPKTGTWEVDRTRFPKGLREVSDFVHAHGMKSILWFEPERVHTDTWIATQHPDWVFDLKTQGLLKIGEPKVREWLTDHIDKFLTDEGIDIYRQDFNIDPLPYWRGADEPDRQGITEMKYVEGYLAYWHELLKRHPKMFIDSCASGGRRNDVETLRRAVPLLRSDWYNSPEGQQCHTYGLSLWFPYQGTGFIGVRDEYWIRSSMAAETTFGPGGDGTDKMNFDVIKKCVDDFREFRDCILGDFYPLTPYSLSEDVWMAWQYDSPERGKGAVQAFRRGNSDETMKSFRLRGLDNDATYEITNLDTRVVTKQTGRELMETGLTISIDSRPGSAIVVYRRV